MASEAPSPRVVNEIPTPRVANETPNPRTSTMCQSKAKTTFDKPILTEEGTHKKAVEMLPKTTSEETLTIGTQQQGQNPTERPNEPLPTHSNQTNPTHL